MRVNGLVSLPALLTGAASPQGVSLHANGAPDVPLPLWAACELVAAYSADLRDYGLGLAPPIPLATAVLTVSGPDEVDVTLADGALRYFLSMHPDEGIVPLCLTPGCNQSRLGRTLLTSVCESHLGTIVPGLLPNAGDDIRPGDLESAAVDSRVMRVKAFADEAFTELVSARGAQAHADVLLKEAGVAH